MLMRSWRLKRQLRRALHLTGRPTAVIIATFQDEVSARLTAGRLTDAGIRPFVFDQAPSGTTGYPTFGPVHVLVHPQDEAAACALLTQQGADRAEPHRA
jgi:hypothetical protein